MTLAFREFGINIALVFGAMTELFIVVFISLPVADGGADRVVAFSITASLLHRLTISNHYGMNK